VSKWAGKYVIGITGNIGTGKSVVRKMLEHLGAFGIDADALGHRAIAKGAPGYKPVLETFGKYVLGADEQIDRNKLSRIVFTDPEALPLLEKIVHPLVDQALDLIIRRATQRVVVVEAIKLVEANIYKDCNSLWVTYAPPEVQLARLIHNRHMSESEARQRMASQPPQERKMASADVIIKNVGAFEGTWNQVVAAWKKEVPAVASAAPTNQVIRTKAAQGDITILRGSPHNSLDIAYFINRNKKINRSLQKDDVMAAFGEKAFLLLRLGDELMGLIGWQVENLIVRTTDILLDPAMSADQALPPLISEMERASRDLQCEASLIFAPVELAKLDTVWKNLGYERRLPQNLGIQAWQEAAIETMPPDTSLFFKQLRQDRILRPI
jgi:dephospho-CoA kinase